MTGFVITQLSLCDFRGFSGEKSWTLGQLTKITGHNYQGKSSIADAIAFALFRCTIAAVFSEIPPVRPGFVP